ncbi:shikimate kinase AroK [Luminiphilus sp.]|nr:shikimate kinase AroK [Luminiphilus sp.]
MLDMSQDFRLFMIGPMGSGKSTVGRVLANLLGCSFVDSDAEIEARCGADIPWIFDVEGEVGFRRREAAVLSDLAKRSRVVIATGGGAVTTAGNRELMSEKGIVVYLDVSIEQQLKRTGSGEGRPLLAQGDREATLKKLMLERKPLYEELADMIVSASSGNARKVARHIQEQLSARSLLPPVTD